jgi:hypothetical protein
MKRWHAPASRLLGFVEAHLHPAERMHELALALVRPDFRAPQNPEGRRVDSQ